MAVSTSPHHTLTSLYGKTLRAIAKMPENAGYRKNTERIVTERAKIVANVSSTKMIKELFSYEITLFHANIYSNIFCIDTKRDGH